MISVTENGIALLNTTIDNENGEFPNRYFDAMRLALEAMGAQVIPFKWKDLAEERARDGILQSFAMAVVSGNDGYGPHFEDGDEFKRRLGFMLQFAGRGLFVCRGGQFYLRQMGAEFAKDQKPEHGPTLTSILKKDDHLVKGLSKDFLIYGAHAQRIDQNSLPSNVEVVAESKNGTLSIAKIIDKDHWISQNHPEYLELEARVILHNLLRK